MKRFLILVFLFIHVDLFVTGQKSNLSVKTAITLCTTRKIQEPPNPQILLGNSGNRIGINLGGRYTYRVNEYAGIGVELSYLLKGFSGEYGDNEVFSDHYIGLSPFMSGYPLAKSGSEFLSAISIEFGIGLNYCINTEMDWSLYNESKSRSGETGMIIGLGIQTGQTGFQLFLASSFTPYITIRNTIPPFIENHYSQVFGLSMTYRFF